MLLEWLYLSIELLKCRTIIDSERSYNIDTCPSSFSIKSIGLMKTTWMNNFGPLSNEKRCDIGKWVVSEAYQRIRAK